MKCWSCNHELIWGGDHDTEWEDNDEEEHMIVTNLSCPNCESFVLVYRKRKEMEIPSPTPDAPWLDKKNSNRN